ncbi:hypothetical protein [Polluticoccus soli]|uniref:hypothetical protein n=1 Tax=Polluticoccus soli TaxID=3034150 RepID=UPI0023E334F9|nr:hypothetical protein [Flavipsychrobacter sp. JY13-12]
MVFPTDKDYLETKQIMLGKQTMRTEFVDLAKWIKNMYQVNPINIYYDTMDHNKRPRLEIIFEFEEEANRFNVNGNQFNFNFDPEKQKMIAKKFVETQRKHKRFTKQSLFKLWSRKETFPYNTEDIFIYFSAFEPIAIQEAFSKVKQKEVTELQQQLNNPNIWTIVSSFSSAFFFVFTDDQVKKYKDSLEQKDWSKKYFQLLQPYNEFGYLKPDTFNVFIDSKENFDTNFEGNWYYYFK